MTSASAIASTSSSTTSSSTPVTTILAGDIGGTKTLLQICEIREMADAEQGVSHRVVAEQRFDSQAYDRFETLLQAFLAQQSQYRKTIGAACFGIAGPIKEDIARVTNLPWVISAANLESETGIPHISLINDFQAIGYGIEGLGDDDLITLQQGVPLMHGVRAVIGAGTGLGEGFLVWHNDHYQACPSEGGHVDFGPVNEEQVELLRYWQKKGVALTYEQLVSGPGLCNIFEFVVDHYRQHHHQAASAELLSAMSHGDAAAAIAQFALNGHDALAEKALQMFVQIYGAQAGNLALTTMAQGGVYIAGGIAAKILNKLTDGLFMQSFGQKGKMNHLMPGFPVHVITNPQVGLVGAALVAARQLDCPR